MTFGLIDVDLAEQERLALLHFVGLGVAVARRPALDDVGDVDVLAPQADGLDDLRQQLPGAADERLALDVFVGARRLAHEHQVGVRVADAEHDLLAPERVQLAAGAVGADVVADGRRARRLTGRSRAAARRGSRWAPGSDHAAAVGLQVGRSRARRARATAASAAEPVDAELAEELEVIAIELIVATIRSRHRSAPRRRRTRRAGRSRRGRGCAPPRASLLCSGTTSSPSGVDDRDRVGRRVEAAIGLRHVVGDDQVDASCARACRAPCATTSSVSAANPTSTGAAPPRRVAHRAQVRQDVPRPLERQRQRRRLPWRSCLPPAAPACSRPPRPP